MRGIEHTPITLLPRPLSDAGTGFVQVDSINEDALAGVAIGEERPSIYLGGSDSGRT